jgi:hypothetical protein
MVGAHVLIHGGADAIVVRSLVICDLPSGRREPLLSARCGAGDNYGPGGVAGR